MLQKAKSVRDLEVYKLGFATAMEIFGLTKEFPVAERYSLVDQIRRSSRSVCSNLSEAWRKRRYVAVFVNKLMEKKAESFCK
jgi:four helix bundle protein